MQLLVYARNYARTPTGDDQAAGHQSANTDADGPTTTFVGMAIGDNPHVVVDGRACADKTTSYVEVRIPADTIDPLTAVPLLVAKAIAREPRANRRAVALSCTEGVVRLKLEPGFADAAQLCAPLIPLLQCCRVYSTAPAVPRLPRAPLAQPEAPVRLDATTIAAATVATPA